MADYKSAYTGEEIDGGIAKANTAVQPSALSAYQELLVSGENIKTINNNSILGEGNITIEGGGGTSNFNVKVVDATNPDDWDSDNDGPSQAVLEDIVSNQYQAIRIINVPMDEYGSTYELDMFLTGLIDSDENEYWAREYQKFDSGDGEEQEPAFMQTFTFTKEGDDDAEMRVNQYELDGGGSSGGGNIYFSTHEIGGTYNDEVSLDLSGITNAIDNGSEVIIRVNGSYGYDTRYFRIETTSVNGKTTIDGNDYWTPILKCKTNETEYTMVFDRYASEAFIYKIYDSYPKFTPTSIDLSNNAITFEVTDYSYMFNAQPRNITLNLGDNGSDLWIDFKLAIKDETVGSEAYSYISNIIPDHSSGSEMTVFTLVVYNDGGNVSTKIYIDQLTTTVPA